MSGNNLKWPDSFDPQGKIFVDLPLFGAAWKARKHIDRQMRARSPASMREEWACLKPEHAFLVADVSVIIMRWMEWSNWYYYPNDQCDIIFIDPFYLSERHLDALLALDKAYPEARNITEIAMSPGSTFAQLIEHVLENSIIVSE